jgi:hypothetical protein
MGSPDSEPNVIRLVNPKCRIHRLLLAGDNLIGHRRGLTDRDRTRAQDEMSDFSIVGWPTGPACYPQPGVNGVYLRSSVTIFLQAVEDLV